MISPWGLQSTPIRTDDPGQDEAGAAELPGARPWSISLAAIPVVGFHEPRALLLDQLPAAVDPLEELPAKELALLCGLAASHGGAPYQITSSPAQRDLATLRIVSSLLEQLHAPGKLGIIAQDLLVDLPLVALKRSPDALQGNELGQHTLTPWVQVARHERDPGFPIELLELRKECIH